VRKEYSYEKSSEYRVVNVIFRNLNSVSTGSYKEVEEGALSLLYRIEKHSSLSVKNCAETA
jgi:hypothetical protein